MVLYVIPVPDPPMGADWKYTIPGQYIENITAITGRLRTFSAQVPVQMFDASGNGNNGVYGNGTQTGMTFVAGLVSGDAAVREVGAQQIGTATPLSADPLTGDFTIGGWIASANPSDFFNFMILQGSANPTVRFQVRGNSFGGFFQLTRNYTGLTGDFFTTGTMPLPAGPNFITAVYTAANNHVVFYLNGTAFAAQTYAAHPMVNTTDRLDIGNIGAGVTQTFDEMFLIESALSAGNVAALYTAGLVGWDTWNSTLLAFTPFAYYQLDDAQADTGRAVLLDVTDGTHVVLDLPAGVPTPTVIEPFVYSWIPNLNSSTITPRPTTITAAIPPLVLPAGYTVGTRTLDLTAVDQWDNVTVWWNSNVMDSIGPGAGFDYGDGAFLTYQQQGVP